MAGDDELCNGWFKSVQSFIEMQKINVVNEAICIYSDWKQCTPENQEYIFKQNLVANSSLDIKGLKIRGLICNRSMLQSGNVISQMTTVDLSHGVTYAEANYDMQPSMHSQKNYYCPFVGSIYYNGIGVSTKMNTPKHYQNYIDAYESLLYLNEWRMKDAFYLKYLISYNTFLIRPSIGLFFKTLWLYTKSMDYEYGTSLLSFVRVINKLLKSLK